METLARRSDPVSSHLAGLDAHSFREHHYREIVRLVSEHPNHTAKELAQYSDLEHQQISRRMKELEKRGQIRRVLMRTCRVGGKLSTTWELAL